MKGDRRPTKWLQDLIEVHSTMDLVHPIQVCLANYYVHTISDNVILIYASLLVTVLTTYSQPLLSRRSFLSS